MNDVAGEDPGVWANMAGEGKNPLWEKMPWRGRCRIQKGSAREEYPRQTAGSFAGEGGWEALIKILEQKGTEF